VWAYGGDGRGESTHVKLLLDAFDETHTAPRYVCKLFDVYHSPNYVHLVMENGGSDLYVASI
jgi:hypothetical protein